MTNDYQGHVSSMRTWTWPRFERGFWGILVPPRTYLGQTPVSPNPNRPSEKDHNFFCTLITNRTVVDFRSLTRLLRGRAPAVSFGISPNSENPQLCLSTHFLSHSIKETFSMVFIVGLFFASNTKKKKKTQRKRRKKRSQGELQRAL